jgi:hypothetical protein
MKRLFSHPIAALLVGLCLRLFFVLKFPANSGDTVLYEQMAGNWLLHHVYAMNVDGVVTPVDLRMPGYPAYLVLIYLLSGKVGAAAHLAVMLGQVAVDLLGCVAIAALGAALSLASALPADGALRRKRVFVCGLWIAALCPFTANYTAVLLTETFANFFTAAAFVFLAALVADIEGLAIPVAWPWRSKIRAWWWAAAAGFAVGLGTLFRPETPLILIAAWLGMAIAYIPRRRRKVLLQMIAMSALACVLPLLPWAVRNAVTLHEIQFLTPKNSNLPGELVPYGFMSWEKTWLFRLKDSYLVSWKLNSESIQVASIPSRAFDNLAERSRVAAILESYNNDLTLTADEDAAFAELARERTARHPLRTYLLLPAARGFTLWFTPRIELLPVSGTVFPLRQSWEDDKVDQSVTLGFFFLNIAFVLLGICGAWRLWKWNPAARPAALILVLFVLLRTAFLTTMETPEPRYVLECYPVVLAFAAMLFVKREQHTECTPEIP